MITEGSAGRFAAVITWTVTIVFFMTAPVIAACPSPRLTQLSDGSEGYAVFRAES